MRKHIVYNTVNFQPVTFRILFFRGIQTLQMWLSREACFWWTQLLRPFCRAADGMLWILLWCRKEVFLKWSQNAHWGVNFLTISRLLQVFQLPIIARHFKKEMKYNQGMKYTKRLQSDIHWNPLHQNYLYLDTDKVILSLISTSKKQKFTSIKEEINAMISQEVNFQKSQKLLASRAGSSKQTIARTALT